MTYIVTLKVDEDAQAHFDGLRKLYFPVAINYIDAHVTLFHTLPEQAEVLEELAKTAAAYRPFSLAVTGVRSLGKGVAYTLESATLQHLQQRLAIAFAEHLSPQDRQRFQPHIVVQNKVTPETAKSLLHHLRSSFTPMRMEGLGMRAWHYRNGPWELAHTVLFREPGF